MNTTELIFQEIDRCITSSLGLQATRGGTWATESELSFELTYVCPPIEITIWRDRGLFSVFLTSPGNSMVHSLNKFTAYLNLDCNFDAVETPNELLGSLSFIKENFSSVVKILGSTDSDRLLDQVGPYRSISKERQID